MAMPHVTRVSALLPGTAVFLHQLTAMILTGAFRVAAASTSARAAVLSRAAVPMGMQGAFRLTSSQLLGSHRDFRGVQLPLRPIL